MGAFPSSSVALLAGIRGPEDVGLDRSLEDWKDRYWKNVPGPFYGTDSTLLLAAFEKSDLVTFDDFTEFVWRQPSDERELRTFVAALNGDALSSFKADGNAHWDRASVREWAARAPEIVAWAEATLALPMTGWRRDARARPEPYETTLRRLVAYYTSEDLTRYLREYVFALEEGRAPGPSDRLPSLDS